MSETTRREPVDLVEFYGYRFRIIEGGGEGRYHETMAVQLEVLPPLGDTVLHVITMSDRGSHQLRKRYRPPSSPRPLAIAQAEHWVLAHCPDAAARRSEADAKAREDAAKDASARLASVGGDVVAFLAATSRSFSTTDVGKALGLGSARRLNSLLVEWNLLLARHGGYDGVNPDHGAVEGWTFPQWRWNIAGVLAIWAAATAAGIVTGGVDEMVRRIKANTDWVPTLPQHGIDERDT